MSCHPPEGRARVDAAPLVGQCHGAGRHPGPGHRQAGYREAATVAEQVTESGCEAGELHPPHLLRMPRDDLVGRDTEVGGDGPRSGPS